MRSYLVVPLMLTLLLAGCSSTPRQPDTAFPGNHRAALEQQYQVWRGTPYRLGGLDRGGIDCSGFVYRLFGELYGLQLPRTTEDQAKLGQQVRRERLQVADLVFFKTGWRTRHVGIYLGNGEFLHASTSRGVVISSLDNPYWKRHYWQYKRLNLAAH